MKLPPISKLLDDAIMVNESRDLEMREKNRALSYMHQGENIYFSRKRSQSSLIMSDARFSQKEIPELSEEKFEQKIGYFLKEAIPTIIDETMLLEKSINVNQILNIQLADLYKSLQQVTCLKDKFEKSDQIIALEKKVQEVPLFSNVRTPFFFDPKRVEQVDSLREEGREFKDLHEVKQKLFVEANSIHDQLNEIIRKARNIIEPPDFINLYQEWTQTFGEREISIAKIVSADCQNLTSEILRQENYIELESEQISEKVNAISAARALISLVEKVFKQSFLSYWNSLKGQEIKYKIVSFIISNGESSEEEVEEAFSETNFTLFTAEYFMRLVCELVEINKEFEVSTNAFFNRDYAGWINSNNYWEVLKKIRLNLRNPIMHPNKDWVGLGEYEKYSNFITGAGRFSSWFNASRPGNLFFRMYGSPLLEGQLIARGAL